MRTAGLELPFSPRTIRLALFVAAALLMLGASPSEAVPPYCGDLICGAGENNGNCPTDCFCGNGECDADETPQSCALDCGPICIPPDCGVLCGAQQDSCGNPYACAPCDGCSPWTPTHQAPRT